MNLTNKLFPSPGSFRVLLVDQIFERCKELEAVITVDTIDNTCNFRGEPLVTLHSVFKNVNCLTSTHIANLRGIRIEKKLDTEVYMNPFLLDTENSPLTTAIRKEFTKQEVYRKLVAYFVNEGFLAGHSILKDQSSLALHFTAVESYNHPIGGYYRPLLSNDAEKLLYDGVVSLTIAQLFAELDHSQ